MRKYDAIEFCNECRAELTFWEHDDGLIESRCNHCGATYELQLLPRWYTMHRTDQTPPPLGVSVAETVNTKDKSGN